MTTPPRLPVSAWRPTSLPKFLLGSDHYPEHVDESYWRRDADRMAQAGFTVARLGEFAWHIFEASEGNFSFDFFDRAIEVLAEAGVQTVMCTPTATPPRWLTKKHPKVLRVDANGRQMAHGNRQHADTANPIFRRYSRSITSAMVSHYQDNPNVVGWQTDNELNTSMSVSYSDASLSEFQEFLRAKYGSIGALNHAWGGDFWATAFDDFDDVVFPYPTAPTNPGPGHYQDYHRFLAFSTARFQADQVEIIRAGNPDWFIFHNLGRIDDVDLKGDFTEQLDFLGYDMYPYLHDEGQRYGGVALNQAVSLAQFRGYGGNFIIPEHQIGFGAQTALSTLGPEPGELRRMSMSSVSQGADGILYFRWRAAHFGAEIYWNGLIGHDDVPYRHLAEVTDFARDLRKIEPKLMGTHVRMDIAVAGGDFENQQAYRGFPMGLPNPQDEAVEVFKYCHQQGYATGFIHPSDDLSHLRVLFVPHFVMWKDEWTTNITKFVESGGTVVLTAMTATRDQNSHVLRETAPGGGLANLSGVRVGELGRAVGPGAPGLAGYDTRHAPLYHRPKLEPESAARTISLELGGTDFVVGHMYETLRPQDDEVEVVARWSARYFEGEPAITRRRQGKGSVYYVGTYLTDSLAGALVDLIAKENGVEPLVAQKPKALEVTVRQSECVSLLFMLNASEHAIKLANPPNGERLVLLGEEGPDGLTIRPHGYAIVERTGI